MTHMPVRIGVASCASNSNQDWLPRRGLFLYSPNRCTDSARTISSSRLSWFA